MALFSLIVCFLTLGVASGAAPVFHDPHCGGRQVIVHLFNWKWTDIAQECERYLGPKGFCGVQISPPNEHLVEVPKRPWSERYAPVSYHLTSRSGTEAELRDMVLRCKKVGVRIYADLVINHMAGVGFSGKGSWGSDFDASARSFSGVPYTIDDFNMVGRCPNADNDIHNYDNANDVRNCNMGGLTDLNQGREWVQNKIADYLNSLIDIGLAGFRVDAAKHMWPNDLGKIWDKLHAVDGGSAFVFHEVIPGGAVNPAEYYGLGMVTEFKYGDNVHDGINNFDNLRGVVHLEWGMIPSEHALVFVDNHDNQRGGQLSFKSPDEYKRAQAFTLAFNYGFTRVMSSYQWSDRMDPPPHNGDTIKDVTINSDGSCGNGWICEHRWKPIGNMVRFRNDVVNTGIDNWNVQGDVMSFSRGNVGFFAMGKNNFNIHVYTGLPAGDYCDLISDCAKKIHVDGGGNADVSPNDGGEPFVAITTKSKNGGLYKAPQQPAPWVAPAQSDYKRTAVLFEWTTTPGQDLFIRGGIDYSHRSGCEQNAPTDACAVPIKHRNVGTSSHYDKVNTWSKGDNYLDWYGTELGQGEYQNVRAYGTPAYWSTNVAGQTGYSPLNTFGPNYWVVDVDMDCSRTEGGYFEVKALLNSEWEMDVGTTQKCTGSGAGSPPYTSHNHFARCGYLNVFHYGSATCQITSLP